MLTGKNMTNDDKILTMSSLWAEISFSPVNRMSIPSNIKSVTTCIKSNV